MFSFKLNLPQDDNDGESLEEEAKEIERESARIRKEIESEKRIGAHKPVSQPTKQPPVKAPFLQVSNLASQSDSDVQIRCQHQLFKLQNDLQRSKREKHTLKTELLALQNAIRERNLEMDNAERQVKEHRARAEDARTELMLAEFKRDSAKKELDQLCQQICVRKREVQDNQHHDESEADRSFHHSHMSQEEVAKIITDREELKEALKSKTRTLESLERERLELERQLNLAKQNILGEQRISREKLESLKEEVENQSARVDEATDDKDGLQKKMARLETKFKVMEKEKNEVIRETTEEYERLKKELEEHAKRARVSSSQEVQELRTQLQEVTDQMAKLQSETNKKDDVVNQLRENVLELQHELAQVTEQNDSLLEDHQKNIKKLITEKEDALGNQKQKADRDKQSTVNQVRQEMLRQQQRLLVQTEHQAKQQVQQMQSRLAANEIELDVLKEKLHLQETSAREMSDKMRQEAQDKMRSLLAEERYRWQQEKEEEVSGKLHGMRTEMEKVINELHDELSTERDLVEQQMKQVTAQKKELEEARQKQKHSEKDKIIVIQQLKDDNEREYEELKTKLKKEAKQEKELSEDKLKRQEEEIERLKSEKKEFHSRQQESLTLNENQEKSIIQEINEECRKVAEVLGVMPRMVNIPGYSTWNAGRVSQIGCHTNVKSLTAALGNLRASNEELRRYLQDIKNELDAQKKNLQRAEKTKKEEMDALRKKCHAEKIQAMEALKDRLIKEHLGEVDKLHKSLGKGKSISKSLQEKDRELKEIQQNMSKWKEQTAEKIARKFQEEMAREIEKRTKEHKKEKREWERERSSQQREIERLERDLHRSNSNVQSPGYGTPVRAVRMPIAEDTGMVKHLQQLQNQVRQLQTENSSLRKGRFSTSVPDLRLSTSFTECPSLEDRRRQQQIDTKFQQAEGRARVAEERASKNQDLLSQKMTEVSRLQGSLTQQTKELMQLERAYSQLQQKAARPSSRIAVYT